MNTNNGIEIINRLLSNNNYQKHKIQLTDEELDLLIYHKLNGNLYNISSKFELSAKQKFKLFTEFGNEFIQHETYKKFLDELLFKFNEYNIKYIIIKGLSLFDYYSNSMSRLYNDVDILVDYKDLDIVIKTVKEFGFEFGKIDSKKMELIKVNRQQILFSKLNTHEIVKLVRKEMENLFIKLDFNFLFQWKGFGNSQIPFDELYCHSIKSKQNGYRILIPEYNLLHLCCHFYNETTRFVFAQENLHTDVNELKLFRLVDIMLLVNILKNSNKINDFIKITQNNKMTDPIIFSLKFLLAFFRISLPQILQEFILNNESEQNDINIYMKKNGHLSKWDISVYDRAFKLTKKNSAIKAMSF